MKAMQVPDLYEECFALVRQIPHGKVSTYGLVASALGDARAARAVGAMLAENPYSFLRKDLAQHVLVPCHRVVCSSGDIGGFTSMQGVKDKILLLEREGVQIKNGKIVDFENKIFRDFTTDKPLMKLVDEQNTLAKKIILEDDFSISDVGIVDVSYRGRTGFCAMAVFDDNGKPTATYRAKGEVKFPYIPTYLAYREIPLILKVLEYYRPSLLLIDGNGILHPRKMGIATQLGIIAEIPTIGVAKSLLLGKVEQDRIVYAGEVYGYKCGKYYVSPGYRVSKERAKEIADRYAMVISVAHREAKKMASSDYAL